MLTFLIILLSVMLFAISVGVQIFISKKLALACINDDNVLDSSKVKIGAMILLILNAYSFIKSIISLAKTYTKDYIIYDVEAEYGNVFSHVFSLLILLSYIAFAIFLIKKCKRLALLSATSIVILAVFNAIFVSGIGILNAYISLFPSLLVLSSFVIIFTPFQINSQKIIKATPFLFLLSTIIPTINLITSSAFNFGIALSVVTTILKIIAFLLMFHAVPPSLKNDENDGNASPFITKKKAVLIALLIFMFPLVVSLLSSIGKVWLWVSLILLAIAIPIVIASTKDSTLKTRTVALICTFAVVVGLCFFAKLTPSSGKSNGSGTCGICGGSGFVTSKILGTGSGVQAGFDTYYRCAGCHGSGKGN